jgi:hypothetical protein
MQDAIFLKMPEQEWLHQANKADQFVNNEGTDHLPCGWSKDGLCTFNQLSKEVYKNCNEHGEEFDKVFKKASRKKWPAPRKVAKERENHNYVSVYSRVTTKHMLTGLRWFCAYEQAMHTDA